MTPAGRGGAGQGGAGQGRAGQGKRNRFARPRDEASTEGRSKHTNVEKHDVSELMIETSCVIFSAICSDGSVQRSVARTVQGCR